MNTLILSVALLACAGPDTAELEALGDTPPRLPAPEAQVYATNLTTPSDPLVASVVGSLPWEESLSGAAGALGVETIGGRELDAWWVRWAALRAGYPYPVEELIFEQVPEGEIGQRVMDGLVQALQPGDHVGLVRVRSGEGDLCVGLLARPRADLAPLARELAPGASLVIEDTKGRFAPGSRLSLVSPGGILEQIDPASKIELVLDERGEHWLELRDPQGVVAAVPIYVGERSRPGAPLMELQRSVRDPGALEEAGWELLDELRIRYGLSLPEDDPILAPVARAHLADHLGSDGLRSGGFPGQPGACRASLICGLTVGAGAESCFQQWIVDPQARAALLDARCGVAGMATQEAEGRLWLQLELGED
jgi:hypothetical protein